MSLNTIVLVLLLSSCVAAQWFKDLKTVFEWISLEYEFPSDNDRQYAIDNGMYQKNAGIPIDIAVEHKPNGKMRFFQTIPRLTDGIPFTLATITKDSSRNGPILAPYPDYTWHNANNPNCQGITSAFRVVIDECQQMWVIDSGTIQGVQRCPPQLLVFDLKNDNLIRRFEFTDYLYTPSESLFVNLAVDIRDPPPRGDCRSAMAYVADMKKNGLVVYNSKRDLAWRIEHELMAPRADWGNHTIAGETFELMNGIFTLNISPRSETTRHLFFHAQSDDRESAVPLRHIDNQMSSLSAKSSQFQVLGRRGVQSAMEAIDSKGNIFASTNDPLAIFVWNINNPYNTRSFRMVANNPDQLQFVSGMKVVKDGFGRERLWVSTSSFQKTATNTRSFYNHINFKVTVCLTEDLLKNGRCTDVRNQNYSDLLYEDVDSDRGWA